MHRGRRTEPGLGARVVAFAESRNGNQVGDGECFSLVQQALQSAGARSAEAFGTITPDADYVWGTLVGLADVRPGDVLQFRDFHIVRRITTTMQMPDGELSRSESEESEERDHHSAIVVQVYGGTLTILEQNVEPGGRVVQRNRVETASGTYSSIDQADSSQMTMQVSVEGQMWAYRPQKASPAELAAAQAATNGGGYSERRR